MLNRVLKVSTLDTSPPLLPYQAVIRRALATQIGNNRLTNDSSQKLASSSDLPRPLRYISPSQDVLKIKCKIRDIAYNSTGNILYIATRYFLYVLNTQTVTVEQTLAVKCTKVLVHPELPDCFALLLQESSESRPIVNIYEIKNKTSKFPKGEVVIKSTIVSAFGDNWYSGCWCPDFGTIALVDRGDRLQFVDTNKIAEFVELQQDDAIKLESEVYGLIYTTNSLVVQRVDGNLQVFSRDMKTSTIERSHSHIVTAATFNKHTNMLATGGSDHVVHIFDVGEDMTCVGTFPRVEGQVSSLSFSNDGIFLAWGTKDSGPCPIDDPQGTIESGKQEGNVETSGEEYALTIAATMPCEVYYQHKTPCSVTHVEFSPNNYTVAYACDFDTFPKGGAYSHSNPLGFLRLQ